jgi:hypothetical protein
MDRKAYKDVFLYQVLESKNASICLLYALQNASDLLPALKGRFGSPHLFGNTSVICGAVGAVRGPPERFSNSKPLFSMFKTAILSLSSSKPHLGHLSRL